MITLEGTIRRDFFFPAPTKTTLEFFSDLNRIIFLLPHVVVAESYSDSEMRIRYQTVELGAYTINIFCDLSFEVDANSQEIHIRPLVGRKPVDGEVTLNATSGQGLYRSIARLADDDDGTHIAFDLAFGAKLQRPRGLRMMPRRVVDRIAESISQGRLEEMADGFMANAREAFPGWLAENQSGSRGRTKRAAAR